MKTKILEYAARHRHRFATLQDLHAHLVDVFEGDAPAYSTMTEHLRKPLWAGRPATAPKKPGPKIDFKLSADISKLLQANPGLSANQIAAELGKPATTVKSYLHNVLHYEFKKTRWIPHFLTDEQRKKRVSEAQELLEVLEEAEADDFRFLVTGDESWFFYTSPKLGLWMPESEARPEAQKPSHYGPKTMIVVFWNIHGALIVEAIPKGRSATGEYFREAVIAEICNSSVFQEAQSQGKNFWVHMDNAPIHRAETVTEKMDDFGLLRAPHPPYSPDLAPSDFYLFGALKSRIRGIEFQNSDEIKEWIQSEFEKIPSDELRRVFRLWKMRLKACVDLEGHYVE